MRLCLCVYAFVHVRTRDHAPRIFLENTSLRLQSEVKLILAIILHLSPAIQLTLCVHPSMQASVSLCVRVCICACVCMYLYITLCVVQGQR